MRPQTDQTPTAAPDAAADATFERLRRVLLAVSDARRRAILPPEGSAALIRCCGTDACEARPVADGLTVGRSPECAWPVDDAQLSRQHFRIRNESGQWALNDCASKNGTFVNGRRIASRLLADGGRIEAGASVFVYTAK